MPLRSAGSQSTTSYWALGLPRTSFFLAGYQTSTGASLVGSFRVVSPTPYGPRLVKLCRAEVLDLRRR